MIRYQISLFKPQFSFYELYRIVGIDISSYHSWCYGVVTGVVEIYKYLSWAVEKSLGAD